MTTPNSIFKFSRNGEVYLAVELKDVQKYIISRTILPTDDYWTEGMAQWEKVFSRQWVEAVPISRVDAVQPAKRSSGRKEVHPDHRFFSPYAGFYRSRDDRWGYGIFGGIAHRNNWSANLLFWYRFIQLIFIFPALFYLFGWGLTALFFTPALPTKNYKGYYDLEDDSANNEPTKLFSKTFIYILIGLMMVGTILFLLTMCRKA